ncbi:RagB/SusD family nutrient uptake outer membrane protein [Chitinophaga pollutisoli]|uniref:RagB/SusD family nutrient uptake outer membrane protein n=1 Tax=Chitinophaga pollutisoli TaxID=3133966 RepID=A0ABZ2YUG5_9BACT
MKSFVYCIFVTLGCLFLGCKKATDWLNEPRSKQDVVFSAIEDYQKLLNNTSVFNLTLPTIGQVASDNIIVRDQFIQNLQIAERNSYLWNKDIFEGRSSVEYTVGYQAINYANIVLYGIEEIGRNSFNSATFDYVKGQAHFFRSLFYFELANLFCKPYYHETADVDLGLCLRTSPDINEITNRSSILETYNLIVRDALISAELLPETNIIKTRPSKCAAYLLLARIYLNMSDYENSRKYAELCLNLNNSLLDFNLKPSLNLPYRFPDYNEQNAEVVLYAQGNLYQTIFPSDFISYGVVDTSLYNEYEINDLRQIYFYNQIDVQAVKFKGGYTGNASNFCGLAINEAYLIRAESNIRLGNLNTARNDLNKLLRNRYKAGTYEDYASNNADSLLRKVLIERRKELPFTGNIRWQDLRRINLDPSLATPIYRKVNGILIELQPNDKRYVYPIPQNEINLTGITQNER